MRHIVPTPAALLVLAAIGVSVVIAPPGLTKGLDFWNVADEKAILQEATATQQNLESHQERSLRRTSVGEQIAANLCEDRITLSEAIEFITDLAQEAPDWFEQLRLTYCTMGGLPPTATDRDVVIHYLRTKIKSMCRTAELQGNTSRVAFLTARLARFDADAQACSSINLARVGD